MKQQIQEIKPENKSCLWMDFLSHHNKPFIPRCRTEINQWTGGANISVNSLCGICVSACIVGFKKVKKKARQSHKNNSYNNKIFQIFKQEKTVFIKSHKSILVLTRKIQCGPGIFSLYHLQFQPLSRKLCVCDV